MQIRAHLHDTATQTTAAVEKTDEADCRNYHGKCEYLKNYIVLQTGGCRTLNRLIGFHIFLHNV